MDSTDKRIVTILQENAKLTIKEIAVQLNLTPTPVFERIKKLEKEGIISGYHAKINLSKVGNFLITYCAVTLDKHQKESISNFVDNITAFEEVIECSHIAGQFDYLLKICVKDMEAYQIFMTEKLSTLTSIGKLQTSFVLSEVKENKGVHILS
ncbi:MAG: Lrp/AsnC family transcriptional regulator [Lishizhenia sp.]